ncbi:MAG: hypothetical protein K6B44_08305 [Lachnospiraceae bacterium]|nr:hypothetical protein [Lachnospiraceae bacterium]
MDKKENGLQDTLNLINLDETGVLPEVDPVFQGEVSVDTILLTDISESVAEIDMYDDAAQDPAEEPADEPQPEVSPDTGGETSAETGTLELINLDTETLDIPTIDLSGIEGDDVEEVSGAEAETEITEEEPVYEESPEETEEELLPTDTSDISGEELIDIEKILSKRKKSGKKKNPEKAAVKKPAEVHTGGGANGGRPGKNKPEAGKKKTVRFPDKKKIAAIIGVIAAVFVVLAVVIVVVGSRKKTPAEGPDMYAAGEGLRNIGIAGEGVLVALADAQLAAQVAEREAKPEVIPDGDKNRRVDVSFTSVEQDLKIKFVDSESRRLVSGTDFEVKLVSTSGKADLNFIDDDKDGIIYKTGLEAGDYKAEIAEKAGITIGNTVSTVTIKEHIEYKKIDVIEEVKTEKEVNVAVEDTAGGNEEAEAADPGPEEKEKDTVEYVESTKTQIEGTGGYEKVDRDKIGEPSYVETGSVDAPFNQSRLREEVSTEPMETPTPEPDSGEPIEVVIEEEPTPTEAPSATPTPTPEPNPTKAPDATATPTPTLPDGVTATPTPSGTVTPTPVEGEEKKDPSKDKKTKLKDKDGRQIYKKNSEGKYVEAVYADYYKDIELYLYNEPEYKYTGWQTINGNTYYFDKDGNKVTGVQVIQGVKYEFNAEGILIIDKNGILGIDVSKWNGSINWSEVKASGINYVIIRCGYRGSSTGVLVEDSLFKSNIQGAKAAGLKVGVYFFTQAVNEVEAVEEASMCLELAGKYGLSYPVFLDVEYTTGKNGRADGLDKAARTAVTRAFCETIKNGGMTPGVYSSKTWFTDHLDYGQLSGYKIWMAHYTSKTDFANRYDLWQYSSKGSVNGIEGRVDMNYSYLGY